MLKDILKFYILYNIKIVTFLKLIARMLVKKLNDALNSLEVINMSEKCQYI